MAWKARISRWDQDEAEIRVDVDYLNDGLVVASEHVVRPAGTPDARVLEAIGELGRSARARFPKIGPVSPNVGKVFPIDDL